MRTHCQQALVDHSLHYLSRKLRNIEHHKVSYLLELLRHPARVLDTTSIILRHGLLLLFFLFLLFLLIVTSSSTSRSLSLLRASLGFLLSLELLNLDLNQCLLDHGFRLGCV